MSQEPPLIVFTTVGAVHDAERLARDLVERQLAACVNIIDQIRSVYRWKGEIQEDGEKLLIIKTLPDRIDELTARLHAIHPYDVPEFVVVESHSVSEKYGEWLMEAIR